MMMPGRKYTGTNGYRYGFNGKENDNEVKGEGNTIDFGARMYDPRIAKWFSIDPMREVYTSLSAYTFGANNPVNIVDAEGNILKDKNGNIIATSTGVMKSRTIELGPVTSMLGTTVSEVKMSYEKIVIYADDGTAIQALKLVEAHVLVKNYDSKGNLLSTTKESLSKHGFEAVSDCHGYTFAKGRIWIDDDQVNTLLDHDNYTRNTTESKADAVIFKKGGIIVHSAVRNKDGTYSNDAGIMTLQKNVTLPEASRGLTNIKTPGNVEFVDKQGADKVVDATGGTVSGGVRYTTEAEVRKLVPAPVNKTSPAKPTFPKIDLKLPEKLPADKTYYRKPVFIPKLLP
jgi:RHS repeat-associated protein